MSSAAAAENAAINESITMAHKRSHDSLEKEDAATTAASENLKHTTISDKEPVEDKVEPVSTGPEVQVDKTGEDILARRVTPDLLEPSDAQDEEMKEQLSSPKKKRGREQDDEIRDVESGEKAEDDGILNGSIIIGGRTTRSAPEKKRHRDGSEDASPNTNVAADTKDAELNAIDISKDAVSETKESAKPAETSSVKTFGGALNVKAKPASSSAFAASGFGALAQSTTSGFGALGASKPSVFGSGATAPASGFGALVADKSTVIDSLTGKSAFGSPTSETSSSGSVSAFGATATSAFGGLGGGFGGGFGRGIGTLQGFAAPKPDKLVSEKPAKAFGAPESDGESESGDEDDDEKASVHDKKKPKLSKVVINDGEDEEVTLLQFRAKLFAVEAKEKAWKERGFGTLKVNVPKSCVEFDYNGTPVPGSFDPSSRTSDDEDAQDSKPPRLIMRQENTHRVILNTVIMKALQFEEKHNNASTQILFTAFEDTGPVNMLLRMSEANAKLFTAEIASIQREL